jgi:hypothetical protein
MPFPHQPCLIAEQALGDAFRRHVAAVFAETAQAGMAVQPELVLRVARGLKQRLDGLAAFVAFLPGADERLHDAGVLVRVRFCTSRSLLSSIKSNKLSSGASCNGQTL